CNTSLFLSVCFFFSSRRRHTRSKRDWSSDVCSSDLLSHRQALLQFPAAEKGALALPHKGRFSLLQGAWRCGRRGIGLHLQIGVLGLVISFLRRLECVLRLGLASARTLRHVQIYSFIP